MRKTLQAFIACSFLCHSYNALADIRLIVKPKDDSYTEKKIHTLFTNSFNLPISNPIPIANGQYVIHFKEYGSGNKNILNTIERIKKDPNFVYVVEDRIGHFTPLPELETSNSDELSHKNQWNEFRRPAGIMLESKPGLKDGAWSVTNGSSRKPVVVAVLDTGISPHKALMSSLIKDQKGSIWGWNFSANNQNLADETRSYHGTHVAGIIAAYSSEMEGIGKDLQILPLKIPNSSGMFYESSVINAIYWAVGGNIPGVPANPYPAKVLNMSFGVDIAKDQEMGFCDQALQEAINFARSKGAVLVVAAGNDNRWEYFNAPAICAGTVKVASTGPGGLRSYFSNYGPSVTLAAPGGDKRYGMSGGILSTVDPEGGYKHSGYDFYQGTSMAAPHVTAVAGLIFAVNEALPTQKVEQILYTTTHQFGKSSDPENSCMGPKPCGNGILDAENAVKASQANYDAIFAAPSEEELKNTVVLRNTDNEYITFAHQKWVLKKGKSQEQQQKLHKDVNGAIVIDFGHSTYKLVQSQYRQCDIIGVLGIGCHY